MGNLPLIFLFSFKAGQFTKHQLETQYFNPWWWSQGVVVGEKADGMAVVRCKLDGGVGGVGGKPLSSEIIYSTSLKGIGGRLGRGVAMWRTCHPLSGLPQQYTLLQVYHIIIVTAHSL